MTQPPTLVPLQEEITSLKNELSDYPNLESILAGASTEAQHIMLKVLVKVERRSRHIAAFRKSFFSVA